MRMKLGHLVFLVISFVLIPDDSCAWLVRLNKLFRSSFRLPKQLPSTPPTTTTYPECAPTSGYDPVSNWCYGTYCDESGQLVAWDNFNCKSTSPKTMPPTPTEMPKHPTSRSIPTPPPGCLYHGQYYPPGVEITRGSDRESNWCWVVLCGEYGDILHGDDFNCFPSTASSTSSTPTPTSSPPATPSA